MAHKHSELVQHAHSHGSHAFTHTLLHQHSYKPRSAKRQLSYYFSMHAGSFRVSVIHQTLTRTTGFLMCVHDYSCACVYTHKTNHFVYLCFILILFVLQSLKQKKFNIDEAKVRVCLSVAQHISETSEAIAIKFDKVTDWLSYENA